MHEAGGCDADPTHCRHGSRHGASQWPERSAAPGVWWARDAVATLLVRSIVDPRRGPGAWVASHPSVGRSVALVVADDADDGARLIGAFVAELVGLEVAEADRVARVQPMLGESDAERQVALEHDEQVPPRMAQEVLARVGAGRIADLHEAQPRLLAGKKVLPGHPVLETDALALIDADHARAVAGRRSRIGVGVPEEGRNRAAECARQQVEGTDRRCDLAVLDLAQQARACADELRQLPERQLASAPQVTQTLSDVRGVQPSGVTHDCTFRRVRMNFHGPP